MKQHLKNTKNKIMQSGTFEKYHPLYYYFPVFVYF